MHYNTNRTVPGQNGACGHGIRCASMPKIILNKFSIHCRSIVFVSLIAMYVALHTVRCYQMKLEMVIIIYVPWLGECLLNHDMHRPSP